MLSDNGCSPDNEVNARMQSLWLWGVVAMYRKGLLRGRLLDKPPPSGTNGWEDEEKR